MFTVTIKSHDRVVTAGRINSGKETMHGLSEDQILDIESGLSIHIPGRPPTAHVEARLPLEVWEFEGPRASLPKLDEINGDQEKLVALHKWAEQARVVQARSC